MIARLRGSLVELNAGDLILDVNGVGYRVFVPESTIRAVGLVGEQTSLHIHTHVREDAIQLYGFATKAELRLYETVVGVGGVGPRLALSILSHVSVEAFVRAVLSQESSVLTKIPGIGKKTAARILLELKDKLADAGWAELSQSAVQQAQESKSGAAIMDDVLGALLALGYSEEEAQQAVAQVAEEKETVDESVERLITLALGKLDRVS